LGLENVFKNELFTCTVHLKLEELPYIHVFHQHYKCIVQS